MFYINVNTINFTVQVQALDLLTVCSLETDKCVMIPVIHILQHIGCLPKPVPSFACIGKCSSYVQVRELRFWRLERSCMCCQESEIRALVVSLYCPKAKSGERRFQKIETKAPVDCLCRPCLHHEQITVIPQELVTI
ncbi:unnamed protein product [Trichogramma brassicae]|uniref:Bursicon n=1 Tax=Trichogramma brassicae TaxID=86971 RepID=A0A6H5IJQ5_9HYME|nr:unnamed protein product [Trichogramma brassicae]